MTRSRPARKKQRGSIDELPSGALRVRVHGGEDSLSGKRHPLVEIIPAGPKAAAQAEAARTRLLAQVDERRNPRTSATLDQMLDRYLETLDVGHTTRRMYTRYLELQVRPFIGRLKAGAVESETLDSLYAELRRCRTHCTDKRGTDHRTPREHECDERCRRHVCKPLVVDDDPPRPLRAPRRVREGCALAVGVGESGRARHSPGRAAARPATAVG